MRIGNTRKELTDRGIPIPKFTTDGQLIRKLEKVLEEEEEREKLALAEAERWRKWQSELRVRKAFIERAKYRADTELRAAMDAAGQLYVFGSGTFKQFSKEPRRNMSTSSYQLEGMEKLTEIWNERIDFNHFGSSGSNRNLHQVPQINEMVSKKESKQLLEDKESNGKDVEVVHEERKSRHGLFAGKNVCKNTISLWGRRPRQVAIADNVIYALCETGQIYTWGGNDLWWHEIEPDSQWQTQWRGETTSRSQKMLLTSDKKENIKVDETIKNDDEKRYCKFKTIAQYFGCWNGSGVGASPEFILQNIISMVDFDRVKLSLDLRGKPCDGLTKIEMIDILYTDFDFENKVLGERMHHKLKDLETEIVDLLKRKKEKYAKRLRLEFSSIWIPLREKQIQLDKDKLEAKFSKSHARSEQQEKDFERWVKHFREQVDNNNEPNYTSRNSKNVKVKISGITERGPKVSTPRGYSRVIQLAAGSNHTALIISNGDLYTFGMGAAGRLGLDDGTDEKHDTRADMDHPTLVKKLKGEPVIRVSCGQSHTAAICNTGDLYVWGSCQTGKLGLGKFTREQECYCSIPTMLNYFRGKVIYRVSCGSSHTACIESGGNLYVWGCGDGGRLGLGKENMKTHYTPTIVEALVGEEFCDVSCGCFQTIAITKIKNKRIGSGNSELNILSGGKMYVAGPASVLGIPCLSFQTYESLSRKRNGAAHQGMIVQQVSAGFQHQAAVTSDGELLSWGNNTDGCCGHHNESIFIPEPRKVDSFLQPQNLALQKPCRLSSVYNDHDAYFAVDGNIDGNESNLAHTQIDEQPYCDIDLEDYPNITKINIWNRTDDATKSGMDKNTYSKRLFPCWIMVSQYPFPDGIGGDNLKQSIQSSIVKTRLAQNNRLSTWSLPKNVYGRYVRVQLETTNMLHLAQIEVYGIPGHLRSLGRVSFVATGKNVTASIINPMVNRVDIETTFNRAVAADPYNAKILRQFDSTYHDSYEKFIQRNEETTVCPLCTGDSNCEICTLKEEYKEELEPLQCKGGVLSLDEMSEYLLSMEKPKLRFTPKKAKKKNIFGMIKGT